MVVALVLVLAAVLVVLVVLVLVVVVASLVHGIASQKRYSESFIYQ